MQVTAGTISARVHAIGRWAFAGSILVGAGMGFAGYRPWACLTVFWLLAWAVWMSSALLRGQRNVPGNLVHISLLSVTFLLACHLAMYLIDRSERPFTTMDGQLDASMLFHAALLALGVFLAQSYLGDGEHGLLLRICGLVIMLGAAAAWGFPLSPGGKDAHAITLLSGLFIFAAPRWTHRPRRVFFSTSLRASILLLTGVSVLVMFGLTILWWNVAGALRWQTPQGLFGRGELAFLTVSGASSGSAVLGGTTGYVGWGVFVAGMLATLVRVVVRGRWNRTSFFWIAAAGMSMLAILAPGGYFLPLTAVTFALTWGLLPRICGAPTAKASGLFVVITMIVISLLLGLTRKVGLLVTLSHVYKLSDKQSHGIFGFLLAIVLAWWWGAKRTWLGVGGLLIAALAGGLGELAQKVAQTGRAPEMADWRAHAIGTGLATILMLLCFVVRAGRAKHRGQAIALYRRIAAQGAGGALIVVVVLATTGWMGLSVWRTAEQWTRKRPWFVVSDGVDRGERNSCSFYGVIQPTPPRNADLLMTVSPNGIQSAFVYKGGAIKAGLLEKGRGLHYQSVLGQPFGELSTHRHQEGRFLLVDRGGVILAVDAAFVRSQRGRDAFRLDAELETLKKTEAVVLFDTGQPFDYWRLRPILQMRYPEIPCIAEMPAPKRSTDVLDRIRRNTGARLIVVTGDVNLAHAAKRRLGRNVEIHLIDPDPAQASVGKGIVVHGNIHGFRSYRQSMTPPAQ